MVEKNIVCNLFDVQNFCMIKQKAYIVTYSVSPVCLVIFFFKFERNAIGIIGRKIRTSNTTIMPKAGSSL